MAKNSAKPAQNPLGRNATNAISGVMGLSTKNVSARGKCAANVALTCDIGTYDNGAKQNAINVKRHTESMPYEKCAASTAACVLKISLRAVKRGIRTAVRCGRAPPFARQN